MDGNENGDSGEDSDDHADIFKHFGIGTGLTSADMYGAAIPDNARMAQFTITDAGNFTISMFSAKRRSATSRNTRSRACAVRGRARPAVANILRQQYERPDLLAKHAFAWVARPVP